MVVPAMAAPHSGPGRGPWIAVGVAAAVAVLGVAVWLGTRGSDSTATTAGKDPVPTTLSSTTATGSGTGTGTASSTPPAPTVAPTVATAAPVTAAPVTIPVTAPPVATDAPLHPCPTLHYNDNLPLGMCDEGFPVQLLQIRLNLVGDYGLEEDGQFGPASQAAVRAYQTAYGLPVTGVADYPTWRSLFLGAGLPGEDLDGDGVITPNELIYD